MGLIISVTVNSSAWDLEILKPLPGLYAMLLLIFKKKVRNRNIWVIETLYLESKIEFKQITVRKKVGGN